MEINKPPLKNKIKMKGERYNVYLNNLRCPRPSTCQYSLFLLSLAHITMCKAPRVTRLTDLPYHN